MSSSLSPACNAPKQTFDSCFNSWFRSYLLLVSPPLLSPSHTPQGTREREKRQTEIRKAKDDYEKKCGDAWRVYEACLKREIGKKEGLAEMLEGARREEPLEGWEGIRVAREDEL